MAWKNLLKVGVGVAVLGAIALRPSSTPSGLLPNKAQTPGAVNTAITQENIGDNICNPNWSTKSERPPASYTTALKVKQLASGYNVGGDVKTADYEEDHLISLELGGNPTDPKNLWPEPYSPKPGAKEKDSVENFLHKEVCNGAINLAEAQKEIATDWYAVYKTMGPQPATFGSITPDPDDE